MPAPAVAGAAGNPSIYSEEGRLGRASPAFKEAMMAVEQAGGQGLGLIGRMGMAPQPISRESVEKKPRIRDADRAVPSVCPYCAVGCSQLVYVKDRRIIDIEGNPESPINEGTLCPKGAATYQYLVNPNRLTTVRYRAPHSDHWEDRPLEWAMDRIAALIKETRDASFVERTPEGKLVNQTTAIATLGGATMDIEENYLIKKLFGAGLGVVSIENQARI